jgi:hypothetical protein
MSAAAAATIAIRPATDSRTAVSGGRTLIDPAANSGDASRDPPAPGTSPTAVSTRPGTRTRRTMPARPAPSAMRMANSRVLDEARYAMTPYVPLSASVRPSSAKPARIDSVSLNSARR